MEVQRDIQAQEQELKAWPKVAIIILNWNGWRDTSECLDSLNKVDYDNLEVIVTDNASKDESVTKILQWTKKSRIPYVDIYQRVDCLNITPTMPRTRLGKHYNGAIRQLTMIRLDQNSGFCTGNNIGMMQAHVNGAEFFLILNNDTIVMPNFLKPLISAAKSDEGIGLVGGVICYADHPDVIWFCGGSFDKYLETTRLMCGKPYFSINRDIIDTDWVSGAMMLIPRKVYEKLGGFYERFFIWSEEWDYSLRVKNAGYRLVIATKSRILHKEGGSLGVMKPLSYYYGTRNRLLLKRMYLSRSRRTFFLIFFLLSRIPRYLYFCFQGRWDLVKAGTAAIRDYFMGRTGKWEAHVG